MTALRIGLVVVLCLLCTCGVRAATLHVDQSHPETSDAGDGSEDKPFQTIGKAAQIAEPGDTVLISRGVYREHVWPARGGKSPDTIITYQARDDHSVVIKGS